MFDWLFDEALTVYLILGLAGAAFALAWWKLRKKYYAVGVGVVVVLVVAYIVLHFLFETASNQMKRRVHDIADSVEKKQIETVLEKNLSDDFHTGRYDKKGFIDRAHQLADQFSITSLSVWEEQVIEIDREKRIAKFGFNARPHRGQETTPWYRIVAVFVMTPKESWWQKEEWKMQSFQYFNGVADSERPLDIP